MPVIEVVRRIPRKVLAALGAVAVIGLATVAVQARSSCCQAGASCCYPGSPCCQHARASLP